MLTWQDEFSEGKELDGDCRDIRITAVYLHEPDESNCNWDVNLNYGPDACCGVFRAIVSEFRRQYNLQDD